MPMIEAHGLAKEYEVHTMPPRFFGRDGYIASWFRAPRCVRALDGISFTMEQGESLGLLGANGSGKTTLLRVLAGVTQPTRGTVHTHGHIAALLTLGAGFHPLLTGRENAYLNARLSGMSRKEARAAMEPAAAFAELEPWFDAPVSTYSSGMRIRLGFAVAAHTHADLLLIDEALVVGDEAFQRKCRERLSEWRREGRTCVLASHERSLLYALCDRVLVLRDGRMGFLGEPTHAIRYYQSEGNPAKGVRVLGDAGMQALMSDGCIVFSHNGLECTGLEGMRVSLQSFGQWHTSDAADWDATSDGRDTCSATGRMARLPVCHQWDIRCDNGVLTWRASLVCEEAVRLDAMNVDIVLAAGYSGWRLGTHTGVFGDTAATGMEWMKISPMEPGARNASAEPGPDTGLPRVRIEYVPLDSRMALRWAITNGAVPGRALQACLQLPSGALFTQGTHLLAEIRVSVLPDQR